MAVVSLAEIDADATTRHRTQRVPPAPMSSDITHLAGPLVRVQRPRRWRLRELDTMVCSAAGCAPPEAGSAAAPRADVVG